MIFKTSINRRAQANGNREMAVVTVHPENIDSALKKFYSRIATEPCTLYFPAGVYELDEAITITLPKPTGGHCTIRGDGDSTILRWPGPRGGIRFQGLFRSHCTLAVKDLCLETGAHYDSIALDLGWGTGEKVRTCTLENIRIQPTDRTTDIMWMIGIRLNNATDVLMRGIYIYGSPTGVDQIDHMNCGIVIDRDDRTASAGFNLQDIKIDAYRTGISVNHCEGIYLSYPEITACGVCIDVHRCMAVQIIGGHMDYVKHGLLATQSEFISIAHMVWIKSHTMGTPSHAVALIDSQDAEALRARRGVWYVVREDPDYWANYPFPKFESDPNLVGNRSVAISNCNITFTPGELWDPNACGILVDERRKDGSSWSEEVAVILGMVSNFPTNVYFAVNTDGNRIIGTRLEGSSQMRNDGESSNVYIKV